MSQSTNISNNVDKGDLNEKIVCRELSYKINGLLFKVHNELGRFCREKQYGDLLESLLKENNISHQREVGVKMEGLANGSFTNIIDFVINGQLLIELKAKPLISKEDYYQVKRYIEALNLELGLLVNFRNKYLKPIRIIRYSSNS